MTLSHALVLVPAELVDRPARTDDEYRLKRVLTRRQIESVRLGEYVPCPCGRKIDLSAAYKCLFCGVWFCRTCAERHFGPQRGRDLPWDKECFKQDMVRELHLRMGWEPIGAWLPQYSFLINQELADLLNLLDRFPGFRPACAEDVA